MALKSAAVDLATDPARAKMIDEKGNLELKRWLVLLLSAALGACAATPASRQEADRLFNDQAFVPPSVRINAADVFALSPEMKRYIETDVARLVHLRGRQHGLFDALYDRAQLKLEYDAGMTRNAAEAFASRAGNCLSLVIMTAAFAKEMDFTIRYQNVFTDETWSRDGDFYLSIGHVNLSLVRKRVEDAMTRNDGDSMTIDFLPPADLRGARTWAIDEPTIIAMYMNNRAVESLTSGRMDDAYWWAREAILQDPRFMSAYNTLGVVYQRHGNLAEAKRAFDFILEREPANTRAMSNLALVLHDQGNMAAALELTRKLERMEPNPPFGYFKRGLAAMQESDYKTAKEMFTKEVDRAAYYHEFHFWLALAYVGLGEMEPARKHMTIAVENSTTRKDHDLYAAKLGRIQAMVPVLRR
ncbi:MAG: tetratricopeptide repeat protein [Betaproteobacteria bacterium]|nr:MAG: tetratricopeptide repeat protein [Betaproteobacteria bacterium]